MARLIALIESLDHVCCRYRLLAYRSALEQKGYELEVRAIPRTVWQWLRLRCALTTADGVVLQRKLLRRWQRVFVRQAARYLIYDFDDAVFLRDSYAPKGLRSTSRRRRFRALARVSDAVIAGNSYLANEIARYAGPDRVHLIPTCVEPSAYPVANHTRSGSGVELVWIGSSSTLRGLERESALLDRLGQQWPGLRLKLVCDRYLTLNHLLILPCPWSEEGETSALASADIGISLVPDDLWSRGKCGLKVLQYMAAGLPVIGNPVGVQAELIRHGETGLLAETPEQWMRAVGTLAHDPGLRRKMGQAGRRCVERHYSVAVGAARWLALLEERSPLRRAA